MPEENAERDEENAARDDENAVVLFVRNAGAASRVCVFVLLASVLLATVPAYRIVDLGLPPGVERIEAVAINNRGEALARTRESGFLWREGRYLPLGGASYRSTMGDGSRVMPYALNDRSVVVGSQGSGTPMFMSGLQDEKAFIWRRRAVEDLGAGDYTSALGVNNLGDVVGSYDHYAFARVRGRVRALTAASHVEPSDPSGEMGDVNLAFAVAINDRRQILVNSTYGGRHGDTDLPSRPFLVDGNARRLRLCALPLPKGFPNGRGLALNQAGTVLVVAEGGPGIGVRPYLVRRGKIVPLQLGMRDAQLRTASMNVHESIVGTFYNNAEGDRGRPALWSERRWTTFPRFTGWTLQSATGINDRGMICGTGLHDGKTRAFVLVPNGM